MSLIPLDEAAAELHAAAVIADGHSVGDPFSPWTALAAQLRLVAAGLDPTPVTRPQHRDLATRHVTAALDLLDSVLRSAGFMDLAFWHRHVEHLHTETARLEATLSHRQGTP